MLTAYLSGPYEARDRIAAAATDLATIGWGITSTWHEDPTPITPGILGAGSSIDDQTAHALIDADLRQIEEADVLVAFTAAAVLSTAERAASLAAVAHAHLTGVAPGHLPGASGGRHLKTGYALGVGRDVVLVGQPENLLHRSPLVQSHPDWHTALTALAARLVQHERAQVIDVQLEAVRRQDRLQQIHALVSGNVDAGAVLARIEGQR